MKILARVAIAGLLVPILGIAGLLALPPSAPVTPPKEPACVQLVSVALVSMDTPVKGSFECLDAQQQLDLGVSGYDLSDAGFRDFARDQGRDTERLIACMAGMCEYELSGRGVQTVLVFIFPNPSGLVYRIDEESLS